MSEWNRSTREVSFDQLPEATKAEIHRHIELYNLGDVLSNLLMCIQSEAEKSKKGLFVSRETNHMGVVLTPNWLIWVVSGSKTPTSVLSALLQDIVVQDYADTSFARMVPDTGIQVNGKFTDMTENASAFIGLEENAIGKKFRETVIGAVQNAKK